QRGGERHRSTGRPLREPGDLARRVGRAPLPGGPVRLAPRQPAVVGLGSIAYSRGEPALTPLEEESCPCAVRPSELPRPSARRGPARRARRSGAPPRAPPPPHPPPGRGRRAAADRAGPPPRRCGGGGPPAPSSAACRTPGATARSPAPGHGQGRGTRERPGGG